MLKVHDTGRVNAAEFCAIRFVVVANRTHTNTTGLTSGSGVKDIALLMQKWPRPCEHWWGEFDFQNRLTHLVWPRHCRSPVGNFSTTHNDYPGAFQRLEQLVLTDGARCITYRRRRAGEICEPTKPSKHTNIRELVNRDDEFDEQVMSLH